VSATRLIVSGRVQGVGYRAWTVRQARALGLRGWVRNRRDDSVEILAEGEDAALAELAERCRQGPNAARVDNIRTEPAEPVASEGFEELPTV
jgi:acylphosphatase